MYIPANWYWIVGGDATRAYSSATAAYVPADDAGFAEWLTLGNLPTNIDTEEDLYDVLESAYPAGIGTIGTASQQAPLAYAARIAEGIVLTSTGTPALNATYALDEVSTDQIFQIGLYANQFGTFPSGSATQPYPDMGSTLHTFSVTQFVAFLKVVAPLVAALTAQMGVMRAGGTPTWPAQTATIA